MRNPLNIFFRASCIDGKYFLELKVTKAGEQFLVARNEPFKLQLAEDHIVTLYNTEYTHSSKGGGSKKDRGDKPGVTLTYPISEHDVKLCGRYYADRLRLYSEGEYMGCAINPGNSEMFMQEMQLIYGEENLGKAY